MEEFKYFNNMQDINLNFQKIIREIYHTNFQIRHLIRLINLIIKKE